MSDYSYSVCGSDDELLDLAEFAAKEGLATTRLKMAFNSTDAPPSPEMLAFIAATVAAVGRVLTTYLRERKKRLVIMRHEGDRLVIDNPTDEHITKALDEAHMIFIRDSEETRDQTNRQ